MGTVKKIAALGALGLAIALPSVASASSAIVTHLYLDNASQVTGIGGFTTMSDVSIGNSVTHGSVVGTATLTCVDLPESRARCDGTIAIFKPGTTEIDRTVFFNDAIIGPSTTVVALSGGTGEWGSMLSGTVAMHDVSPTSTNVEVRVTF